MKTIKRTYKIMNNFTYTSYFPHLTYYDGIRYANSKTVLKNSSSHTEYNGEMFDQCLIHLKRIRDINVDFYTEDYIAKYSIMKVLDKASFKGLIAYSIDEDLIEQADDLELAKLKITIDNSVITYIHPDNSTKVVFSKDECYYLGFELNTLYLPVTNKGFNISIEATINSYTN